MKPVLHGREMSFRLILWMSAGVFVLLSLSACNASRYAVHGFGMDMQSAGHNLQQWTPIAQPQQDPWNGNQAQAAQGQVNQGQPYQGQPYPQQGYQQPYQGQQSAYVQPPSNDPWR